MQGELNALEHKEECLHQFQENGKNKWCTSGNSGPYHRPTGPYIYFSRLIVVTDQIAPPECNSDKSQDAGEEQVQVFRTSWPEGINNPVTK